jgi:release factor glutamine methyltransferase
LPAALAELDHPGQRFMSVQNQIGTGISHGRDHVHYYRERDRPGILAELDPAGLLDALDPNKPAADAVLLPIDSLRPSEYTAALIQALRSNPSRVSGAHVLEIGSGSGVVLAALGALGAAWLCGVDVELEAILSGSGLLRALGYGDITEFHHGDMWLPIGDRAFDLIVANLPHFPTDSAAFAGRLPSWSFGGPDGRSLLDRFVGGLAAHLTPGGRAVITHNAFVDLARSRDIAARSGLSLRTTMTTMLHIPVEKLDRMTGSILHAAEGKSIHRYGPYAFGEMHIVEIGGRETIG